MPSTASWHMRRRCSGPGSQASSTSALCGVVWVGTSSTCSSPSSLRAWRATARCPRCGGLKLPPRMPSERAPACDPPALATGRSRADVSVALDEVLERAQLAQSDGAARVQLLRGVADLGAHPELAPVGEARG